MNQGFITSCRVTRSLNPVGSRNTQKIVRWESRSWGCGDARAGALTDLRLERVRPLTVPGGTTLVSGFLPLDSGHGHFRAHDAAHTLGAYSPTHFWRRSSLSSRQTLTPATRPASQQGLWGAQLHSSLTPGPTSADTRFLTKISLCPTLLLPEPRALIPAQLPSHTFLPGPGMSSQSWVCDKPQARRPDVS